MQSNGNAIAKKKNQNIQCLRGTMCLMVVFSHLIGSLPENGTELLYRLPIKILWSGKAAVIGFFILSGYYYTKTLEKYNRGAGTISIITKRYFRLCLDAWIILIFAVIIQYFYILCPRSENLLGIWNNAFWHRRASASEILKNMSFIVPSDTDLIDPPTWTLYFEVREAVLLPVFLFLVELFKSNKIKHAFYGVIVVCLLVLSFRSTTIGYYSSYVYASLLYKITDNTGCCKVWNKGYKSSRDRKTLLENIGGILLLILGTYLNDEFANIAFSLGWIIIVFSLLQNDVYSNNILKRIFSKIGDVSYPLYLVHFVFLLCFRDIASSKIGIAVYSILVFFSAIGFSLLFDSIERDIKAKIYSKRILNRK